MNEIAQASKRQQEDLNPFALITAGFCSTNGNYYYYKNWNSGQNLHPCSLAELVMTTDSDI